MTDIKRLVKTHRMRRVWNGDILSPEKCAAYRRKWCREAGMSLREAYEQMPWPGDPPPAGIADTPTCEQQAEKLNQQYKKILDSSPRVRGISTGKKRIVTEKIRIDEYPDGPGTEFEKLAKQFGLTAKSSCSCASVRARMNKLGIGGCREHRDELLEEINRNYQSLTLIEKVKALALGGLPAWLNPLKPVESMFDEAIKVHETPISHHDSVTT